MRPYYPSAPWLASLLLACSTPDTRQITLPVTAYTLSQCPAPAESILDLSALGDFEASTAVAHLELTSAGSTLQFPSSTRALSAIANNSRFWGYGARRADRLDFVLWPEDASCELFRADLGGDAGLQHYPGGQGGQGIGFAANASLVLIAGGAQDGTGYPSPFQGLSFDVSTGATRVVEPNAEMSQARAFATVSEFGEQLMVAGGADTLKDPATVSGTADVYDPALTSFARTIELWSPRTQHAAVTLSTGEVVLIGGEDASGAPVPLNEVVSPSDFKSHPVVGLNPPRSNPTALLLSDRRLFVAGGLLKAAGAPTQAVGAAEWLGTDATQPTLLGSPPPARFDRAYVETGGAAVLAVGGCEDRPARPGENCSVCTRGCPPREPSTDPSVIPRSRYDAWLIGPDGTLAALPKAPACPHPILLPGSDGSPWLIASREDANGEAIPGTTALYRFDPWSGQFEPAAQTLTLGDSLPRIASVGPDAFVWLSERNGQPVVAGTRLGTRGALANDIGLVALRDPAHPERPAHLVPDHLPNACSGSSCVDTLSYDGGLQLGRASSATSPVCVFIADATFADFVLDLDFDGELPTFSAGGPLLGGRDGACSLGPPLESDAGKSSARLVRRGPSAQLSVGAASATCTVGTERAPLAVCASNRGALTVTAMRVTRGSIRS
jgi:hypothetical protein